METRSTTHSHPLSTSTRAVLAPVEWAEKWIRTALIALPLYGALLFSGTLTHQPDYKTQFRDYAEYITTNRFIVDHLVVSILGTAVAMIGRTDETSGNCLIAWSACSSMRRGAPGRGLSLSSATGVGAAAIIMARPAL